MQKSFLLVVSALCIVMLVAGCTTPTPSAIATSQHNIPEQKNTTEPAISQTPQTKPVTTPVPDTPKIQNQTPPTTAPTTEPTLRPETDPYVSDLGFTGYYFSFDIPGCDMKEIFPAFAHDPDYGIEQPVPKLSSVSAAEIRSFIRDHTERSSENSPFKGIYGCQGVSMSPNWNFAEIHASITPRNARQGNLTDLVSEGNLVPDTLLKIIGTFENTGKIETLAKMMGEVYRDNALVDTFTSEELSVPVNERTDLTYYLKVVTPGLYKVKAYVLYEGKKTDTRELAFTIGGTAVVSEKAGKTIPLLPVVTISAILCSLVLLVFRKRGSR